MPVNWNNDAKQNLIFVFCSTPSEYDAAIAHWVGELHYKQRYTHTSRLSAEHYHETDEGWDNCDFGANGEIVAVLVFSET